MTRVVIEDENGLVSVNAELGANANELAMLFFRALVANGFHANTAIQGMEDAVAELQESY
jgi:hypothetical protein